MHDDFHRESLARHAIRRGSGWAVLDARRRWPVKVAWPRYS